jgi:hypothetical protein
MSGWRVIRGAMAVSGMLGLASCSSPPDAEAPAACMEAIQFEGNEYRAWEDTTRATTAVGSAVRGECADVEPADGLSFPSDGETVEVGTFRGFDRSEVVGAEDADGVRYVYVEIGVSEARTQELVDALTR